MVIERVKVEHSVGEVVACVAVNDAFVMKAWGKQQEARPGFVMNYTLWQVA